MKARVDTGDGRSLPVDPEHAEEVAAAVREGRGPHVLTVELDPAESAAYRLVALHVLPETVRRDPTRSELRGAVRVILAEIARTLGADPSRVRVGERRMRALAIAAHRHIEGLDPPGELRVRLPEDPERAARAARDVTRRLRSVMDRAWKVWADAVTHASAVARRAGAMRRRRPDRGGGDE